MIRKSSIYTRFLLQNKSIARSFCVKNDSLIKFTVVNYDLQTFEVNANLGDNLMTVCNSNSINIRSECGRYKQCGKCHCILSPEIVESKEYIGPDYNEDDLLHVLVPFTDYSRFACQTIISEAFHNKKIFLIGSNIEELVNDKQKSL